MTEPLDPGPNVVVLGGELAAARVAEAHHQAPGPSPLGDARYPHEANALWRWTDSAMDATIEAFVHSFVEAPRSERTYLSACLTMGDLYEVLTYAQRRALEAIRTGASVPLADAFDALSTIDVERIDERDLYVATMLAAEAASYTDTAATLAASGAIDRANEEVSEILADYIENEEGADLAELCGLRVVETRAGRVLLRDDEEDENDPFEPDQDLIRRVLALAVAVEEEGSCFVGDVGVTGTLPEFWVGGDSPAARVLDEVAGACWVDLDRKSGDRRTSVTIWLLEAATAEDASIIAVATQERRLKDRLEIAHQVDRLVAVVGAMGMGGPPDEDAESLARFRPLLDQILGG
jgi:hypothetical protein